MKKMISTGFKNDKDEIVLARENCKKCYGRGFIGRSVVTNVTAAVPKLIPCKCITVEEAVVPMTVLGGK